MAKKHRKGENTATGQRCLSAAPWHAVIAMPPDSDPRCRAADSGGADDTGNKVDTVADGHQFPDRKPLMKAATTNDYCATMKPVNANTLQSGILRALLISAVLLPCTVQALTFRLAGDEVVGNTLEIQTSYEDTFVDLGHVYGLGYREMMDANPDVWPWVPGEGTDVRLPLAFVLPSQGLGGEETIVLNLAEFRLYHFIPEKNIVRAYAVGIGKQGWETPTSTATVTGVVQNPSWTPPASIRQESAARGITLPSVVPPGPDNPLGEYAVALSIPGYLFHGSNQRLGFGMRVSHGCIRLYASDIEELATSVRPGLPVNIINEPVKAGWKEGQLFLEVHPQLEEYADQPVNVEQIIAAAVARRPDLVRGEGWSEGWEALIDWEKVSALTSRQSGIPEAISGVSPRS